jgi:murein DD-endopeptidase MepM/ murein hydrolase activator NlpD
MNVAWPVRAPLSSALLALMAVATIAAPAGTDRCRVELPERVSQGQLVFGRVDPACRVDFAGRTLRLAGDGTFVFGLGRDSAARVELGVRAPDGARSVVALPVAEREWLIERVDGVPPHTVEPPAEIAARIAREQAQVAAARTRDDPREGFRQPFMRPAEGRISGVYGSRRVLNGVAKDPHYGLDIAAPTGTPVVAPAAGVVTLAETDFVLTGGTVLLDHGHGVSSVFIHLSRIDVGPGQHVERGAPIGAVGMTGRATGPHLHWGMNWFEVRVDPASMK